MKDELLTKGEFALFQERIENRFIQLENRWDSRFIQFQLQIQNQMKDLEFRMTTRLGLLTVTSVSVAVALLTWLMKH